MMVAQDKLRNTNPVNPKTFRQGFWSSWVPTPQSRPPTPDGNAAVMLIGWGLRVQGVGFRVWGLGSKVFGLRVRSRRAKNSDR